MFLFFNFNISLTKPETFRNKSLLNYNHQVRGTTQQQNCGTLLLLMNLTLGVIVFYIVWQNRGFEYHYIPTIAMAAYTFTAMTLAVINVFKDRRYESPLMSAARVISLASALVSILSLATAMLTAFGEAGNDSFRQIMTAITGTAVCLLVLAMAIYMIIHSTKEINRLKKEVQTNE